MPLFYHIHRGSKPIKINKNKVMFMSKKNSFWYNVEIRIGKEDYGGYVEYIINIPLQKFTKSLNPKNKNKILLLDEDNIKEYQKLYPNRSLNKEKFAGFDATRIRPRVNNYGYHDELILWNWENIDIKVGQIINSKMKPPIKNTDCNLGLISENKNNNENIKKFGEVFDIYCVALGKKPLAALDLKKFKHSNIEGINKLIEFSNAKGVELIRLKTKGKHYLKDIFFITGNEKNAYKLMYILHSEFTQFYFKNYEFYIAIGLLLGYKKENIIYFNKRNNIHRTTLEDIKIVEEKLKYKLPEDLLFDNVEHLYHFNL